MVEIFCVSLNGMWYIYPVRGRYLITGLFVLYDPDEGHVSARF